MIELLADFLVIPLRTDRTLRKVPYVTYSLCFLNIFVYLSTLSDSNYHLYRLQHHWGFIISDPSLVTLLTSAFIHDGILHLASNLLILWLMGTVLEAGIGSLAFLLLYLASMVCATTLYGLIGRVFMRESLDVPLIGASGAISGITGLTAFRYFKVRVATLPLPVFNIFGGSLPVPIPVIVWVPMWIYAVYFGGRELYLGFKQIFAADPGMVANWAHIGGLGLGVAMALVMRVAQEGRREFALEDSTKAASGHKPRDRSLRELRGLLREHPNDPEILEAMAGLLMMQHEHANSRDLYLKSVRLFLAANLRDRAAISYLNVLHTFPDTRLPPREQITLASTLEALGHFREAARAFDLLIEHYPETQEAQTAMLRAAQLNQRYLDDRAGAERLLRRFIERYPHSHLHNLAQERLRELAGR